MIIKKSLSFNGNARTIKAKKNILLSGILKVADTFVLLLLVPLTLGYVNPYEYGIWITLNSILTWIDSFDVGLGNGLRNKLTEALVENNTVSARKYVSTTFFMLIFIVVILCGVGVIAITNINWYILLNVNLKYVDNLNQIILVSFLLFSLNFVLKFVGNVYQALQLPSAMYVMNFVGHLLSLIVIYILTLTTSSNLFLIAIVYSAAPPLVYALAYPVTFYKLYVHLAPSIKYFDVKCVKTLFNLSVLFFVLQMASLILFSLSTLLISNMFGPKEVTPYNIVQRYFGVIPMLTNIIIAPMWSAATDAYVRGDIEWIKRSNKTINYLLMIALGIMTIMILLSSVIYGIWIGNKVEIPLSITVLMAIYNFIIMWSQAYSYFLNGMGKLKLQAINTVIVAFCFYPLCRYLGREFLVPGILIGMCIVNLSGAIINTIQFNLVVSKKAHGIWNK
jgi:Na+-driven multidrug efflux pump